MSLKECPELGYVSMNFVEHQKIVSEVASVVTSINVPTVLRINRSHLDVVSRSSIAARHDNSMWKTWMLVARVTCVLHKTSSVYHKSSLARLAISLWSVEVHTENVLCCSRFSCTWGHAHNDTAMLYESSANLLH